MRRVWLTLLLALFLSPPVQADMVVVVSARSGIAVMTRNEVVNIFLGRTRQFFNGNEVRVVDMAEGHPDRARFYQGLFGKDPSQVDAYLSKQWFSGRGQPFARVDNSEEVVRWVLNYPGGVGYVDASKVDARVRVVFEFGH
ncbi:MAG: hypothetical protein LWW81_14770 [Rhodocyclales bacterium]|nr:hypothetical protein [Rhodocyclales bacterium]